MHNVLFLLQSEHGHRSFSALYQWALYLRKCQGEPHCGFGLIFNVLFDQINPILSGYPHDLKCRLHRCHPFLCTILCSPFVYIEKVLDLWVQLMKNRGKKSVAFIILLFVYIYMYIYIYIYVCVCVCVCVCIYIYIYIYICVCMYIYIYTGASQ